MNSRMNHETAGNMRLALIATYPKMAKIFMKIANEEGIEAYNVYESFEAAANIGRQMESKVDAILSRGGTAHYIQQAVNIPVIFIPITPFDVAQIVHDLDPSVKEAAIIHYKEEIPEISTIEKMYDIRIHQYTFLNHSDIERAVRSADAKGIQTIIGGEVGVEIARKMGLTGIEIGAGEASVRRAIDEAVKVIEERNIEKRNTIRIRSVFDSISDGVIVADDKQTLTVYNRAAGEMFGNGFEEGRKIPEVLFDEHFAETFQQKKNISNVVQRRNGRVILSDYHPVFLEDDFIGVVSTFSDVTEIQKAEQKIRSELHAKGLVARYRMDDIITQNADMIALKDLATEYAKTESSVLIEGESGTGKELFAQGIHNASRRSGGPFVAVNCAAIAENLLESELFGYESGAFTGANKKGKEGLFEQAHGGTIFLDEIGEISMQLQTSLLRVLQEKEVRRVGGSKVIPVDVRVICATNRDLKQMIREGTFRNDLYYRLNVLNISIPPLRRRKDDLRPLCMALLSQNGTGVTEDVLEPYLPLLTGYNWPGNIRELHNIMERFCALRESLNKIGLDDPERARRMLGVVEEADLTDLNVGLNLDGDLKEILHRVEKQVIDYYMEAYGNDQDMVSKRLGIGKSTLWRKRNDVG